MGVKADDICGLGNAIVDALVHVSEEELAALGLEKGSSRLIEWADQNALLEKFKSRPLSLVSGGSVGNSVIAAAQLGARVSYISCLGADEYGRFYAAECVNLKVGFASSLITGERTGTCLVLRTPDGERTMRTFLGAAAKLSAALLDEESIRRAKWLFIEGYVLANPELGPSTVFSALEMAQAHGSKIALTVSDKFIVNCFESQLMTAARRADLIFANEGEACALTRTASAAQAMSAMKDICRGAVITLGPAGVLAMYDGEERKVNGFPCRPVDLTGAGDMFAGAFLYGLTHGMSLAESARAGCYLAMRVITQEGARLGVDPKSALREMQDAA